MARALFLLLISAAALLRAVADNFYETLGVEPQSDDMTCLILDWGRRNPDVMKSAAPRKSTGKKV